MSSGGEQQTTDRVTIEMPNSTAHPLTVALGITLLAAGLVTQPVISVVGFVLLMYSAVGWCRQVFTPAGESAVEVEAGAAPATQAKRRVEALRPGMPGHRMRIPEKVHPYSAGAKGGLVGGVVMAGTAVLYGVLSGRGIWYPINLLAAMVMPRLVDASAAQMQLFHPAALAVATVIHGVASLGVGLMFGVLLPTLPRGPVLWGGIIAPLLWTGGIHAFMGVLNPALERLVDWKWFLASQFAYGLTVGIVVVRTEKVYVSQRPPVESPE
jgi:hypothetical protein